MSSKNFSTLATVLGILASMAVIGGGLFQAKSYYDESASRQFAIQRDVNDLKRDIAEVKDGVKRLEAVFGSRTAMGATP